MAKNAYKLCFLLLACVVRLIRAADYTPVDNTLLNCGSSEGETTDINGRVWGSDGVHIKGAIYTFDGPKSFKSRASVQKPSVIDVPYMSARISKSPFTYSFPMPPGRKFIRLYFYPVPYSDLNPSYGVFSVTAGDYTLMKDFSPIEYVNALNVDVMVKEYSINLKSGPLNITFTPSSTTHPYPSFAYVNGVEIVSHPDIYSSNNIMLLGASTPYPIGDSTALENVVRMNVGGNYIQPTQDTGLFRTWDTDTEYIYGAAFGVPVPTDANLTITYPSRTPTYIAPVNVYKTGRQMGPWPEVNANYNLTWTFDVDTSYFYLVRLHFAEIFRNITLTNERVFQIFINDQLAEAEADVIAWGWGKKNLAIYKDYIVQVIGNRIPRKDLMIGLHPNKASRASYCDAILNGVEIFKLSNYNHSLAGLYPLPVPRRPPEQD